jgi:hypothetical protein
MRLACLLFLSSCFLPLTAAEVDLVRVWPGYRTAESFVSIREYFGGEESPGKRTIVRTQPQERSGFYWLARVRSDQPVPDATAELAVIRPGRTEPDVHRFSLAIPRGQRAILLGLTGSDWADPSVRPSAWRLRLFDSAGQPLASEQSFVWALPDAPSTE